MAAFAYSHGLVWAVESQQVTCCHSLKDWLDTILSFGAGYSDALFLAAADRADDLREIDAIVRAFAASAELLKETVLQGEAFAKATREIWQLTLPGVTYPVAVGHAAHLRGLPLDLTLTMFLQAFLSNLATAGIRLVPLGQTEAQSLIKALTPLCMEVADKAQAGSLADLSSTAFMGDIA